MITYRSDGFGLNTLFVWHGSAVFRAILPASFSTSLIFLYEYTFEDRLENRETIVHPYAVAVFVVILGFLLVFRLNYSYQRHWEAATQLHVFFNKLLDSAITLSSFHYQCNFYDDRRPLAFGSNRRAHNETRERERQKKEQEIRRDTISVCEQDMAVHRKKKWWSSKKNQERPRSYIQPAQSKSFRPNAPTEKWKSPKSKASKNFLPSKLRKNSSVASSHSTKRWSATFAGGNNTDDHMLALTGLSSQTPSLFLQEAAHLYSLLSAVALATLRCDVEGAESPLAPYIPGAPLPPANPDELSPDIQMLYYENSPVWNFIYYIVGVQKSQVQRTLYNAARPFRVIGGISDGEARMLQLANGPSARMALCSMWLKEFISREHLNGSTGEIGGPIVARVYHFLSDGMTAYHHCLKIAFVPFPFPHDQATVFFTFLSLFIFPLLFASYVGNPIVACLLNAVTVICFVGTHEVARELSNPYYTVPNDLPLNNFQAQLNEALVCIYAGFHPDSWRADDDNTTVVSRKTLGAGRNEMPLSESPGFATRNEVPFSESPSFGTRNEVPFSESPGFGTRNEVPFSESPGFGTRNEVPFSESPGFGTRNELPLPESPGLGVRKELHLPSLLMPAMPVMPEEEEIMEV